MSDLELPVTRYAMSGDVSIAYQTMGDGPIDLIIVPGMVSHVEFMHEGPGYTASLRRLSSFARVVTFDKRGQAYLTGCRAPLRSSSEWMTFGPLWITSARSEPRSWVFPKDQR